MLGPLLQHGLLLLEGHLLLQEALLVLSSEGPLRARVTHACNSGLASKPEAGSGLPVQRTYCRRVLHLRASYRRV